MILGGDFSLYDPIVNWREHTWDFAFIKVSEADFEDPKFKFQWQAAHNFIYRAGYHFFRPLVDWRKQADRMLTLFNREGHGELPPVLDLEASNGVAKDKVCTFALEWLSYMTRETGKRPIVYTSRGFSDSVEMYRYPDFGDYPLWEAAYPWDQIHTGWSESQRAARLHEVILGTYVVGFPGPPRPWYDQGKVASFWQFTGKCPPGFVPGYPLEPKDAVDVNFYRGDLTELKFQFNLPELPEGGEPMPDEPVTWKATLKPGQTSRLRAQPDTSAAYVEVTAPTLGGLEYTGTGEKLGPNDGYYWGKVLTIGGTPRNGFVAFTTSFQDVVWFETPPPDPTEPKPPQKVEVVDKDGIAWESTTFTRKP